MIKEIVTRLFEAKSSPLYHGTSWENAYSILLSNKLIANRSNRTETIGVSFTRNPGEFYSDVGLVIDQQKLSYNYKIHPVYREGIAGRDLAEERVDKTITNLDKYLLMLTIRQRGPNDDAEIKTRILRKKLISNFGNHDFILSSDNYIAYMYKTLLLAKEKGIKIHSLFEVWLSYIEDFLNDIPDTTFVHKNRRADMHKNR